jgi:hypothetical protein
VLSLLTREQRSIVRGWLDEARTEPDSKVRDLQD